MDSVSDTAATTVSMIALILSKFTSVPVSYTHLDVYKRQAVDGTEVAVAVNERISHGEVLRQTHHGVIDGGVAVKMCIRDSCQPESLFHW